MGIDVHRGEAHEDVERQDDEGEPAAVGASCEEQYDGGDADMAAGECRRGPFAGIMGDVEQVVEEAIAPPRCRHAFAVGEEPVADVGEQAVCDVVGAYCEVVELRSCDGEEYEYEVVGEEGCEEDECRHGQLVVATEEIVEQQKRHEREIADVAEAHEFGEPSPGDVLGEEQRGVAGEDGLFARGEEVVEIGEDAVEFVGVGIPPREEYHLNDDAQQQHEAGGAHVVDDECGHRRLDVIETQCHHGLEIRVFRQVEGNQDECEEGVGEPHQFEGEGMVTEPVEAVVARKEIFYSHLFSLYH